MAKHRRRKLKMTKRAIAARRRYRRRKSKGKHRFARLRGAARRTYMRKRGMWHSLGKHRLARLHGAARLAYMRKLGVVRRGFRQGMRREHRNPFAFLRHVGRPATYHGAARRARAAQAAWHAAQHYAATPHGPRV